MDVSELNFKYVRASVRAKRGDPAVLRAGGYPVHLSGESGAGSWDPRAAIFLFASRIAWAPRASQGNLDAASTALRTTGWGIHTYDPGRSFRCWSGGQKRGRRPIPIARQLSHLVVPVRSSSYFPVRFRTQHVTRCFCTVYRSPEVSNCIYSTAAVPSSPAFSSTLFPQPSREQYHT
jgi:hypothetical protein